MNQVPAYVFELIAPKRLLFGFDNTWVSAPAGWVFSAGTWSFVGAGVSTPYLTKVFAVPANTVIEITLVVRLAINETVEVSFFNPALAVPYDQAQGIVVKNLTASAATQIIRARVNTYANVIQAISIVTRVKSPASPINITLLNISVSDVIGNRRVIQPGNFKSLNFDSDRSPEYWGAAFSLSGNIQVVGEDWLWVRDLLYAQPAILILLRLTISDSVNSVTFAPALLDTINISAVGDGHTYSAIINLLKETEWTSLLSYFNERLSLTIKASVLNFPVIDSVPVDGTAAQAAVGKTIQLTQKFKGFAQPVANVSVPSDGIYYVGFGQGITINDNFDQAAGVGTKETLSTRYGTFESVIGTVQLNFNANGMGVETVVNNTFAWTPVVSGVPLAINITTYGAFLSSKFYIRVRNNTGAAKNFSVTGTLANNFLDVTTKIKYSFYAVGYRPYFALKHYLARIVGEYDNIDAPVFETRWPTSAQVTNVNGVNIGFANPPVLNSGDSFPLLGNPIAAGNSYTGGTNNWRVTGGNIQLNSSVRSNALLIRAQGGAINKTGYFSKGSLTLSVTITAIAGVSAIKLYGRRGLNRDLLFTIAAPVVGAFVSAFVSNRVYDGMEIECEGAGAFSITITLFSVINTNPVAADGAFSKLHISNGLNSKNTGVVDTGTFPDYALATSIGNVINSLSKLCGLALYPEVDPVTGLTKVIVDSVTNVFLPAVSAIIFELQDFSLDPDQALIYDTAEVGGKASNDFDFYGDASSAQSNYTSDYISSKRKKIVSFEGCLNVPLIVNQELGEEDIIILDMFSIPNNSGGGNPPIYRLDENLTIVGSLSPLQPNWLYSEGRILRNNRVAVFAGGTDAYRLIFGKRSNAVTVDFSGDALGPIADIDIILGAGIIKPWLVVGTSDMYLSDLALLMADIHKRFDITVDNVVYQSYIRNLSYNFASGKIRLSFWLKNINIP
jgi:hypothetical protein